MVAQIAPPPIALVVNKVAGPQPTIPPVAGGEEVFFAFPPLSLADQVYQRYEAVGGAIRALGHDELGGSIHQKTVPRTILLLDFFKEAVPWFTRMSCRRWYLQPYKLWRTQALYRLVDHYCEVP